MVALCSGDVVTVECRAVEGNDRVFDSDNVVKLSQVIDIGSDASAEVGDTFLRWLCFWTGTPNKYCRLDLLGV